MRRRTFDALATAAGLLLAVVLLVAGVLLIWGHSYANNQVSSQLSAQKIVFPTTSSPEFKILPAANRAAMAKYAGQLMTSGAQAEVYANDFIGRHLFLIGCGKTYSQLSAESLAQPKNATLAGQVQTVFRGTTLRSMGAPSCARSQATGSSSRATRRGPASSSASPMRTARRPTSSSGSPTVTSPWCLQATSPA
jgi:hypothetical protein